VLCLMSWILFDNSDIVKADAFMKQEEHATTALFVLRVGPDAYKDKANSPGNRGVRLETLYSCVRIPVRVSKSTEKSFA